MTGSVSLRQLFNVSVVVPPIDDRQKLSQGQREACWDFADTRDYAKGLDAFLTKTRPQFKND